MVPAGANPEADMNNKHDGGVSMFTTAGQALDEGPQSLAAGIDLARTRAARGGAAARPARAADNGGADDAALAAELRAVAQGDQRAFGRLYDATLTRVYAVVRRVVFDPGLAEEVVEDVYMQAWRTAASYDPARGVVLAWLLMMARSRALDALRRADEAQVVEDPHQLVEDAEGHDDPADLIDAVRRDSLTYAALDRVPARDRQLLALAFLRGLTHAEIAEETRLPLGTVKTSIRRALQTMRAVLVELAPQTFGADTEGWNHEAA
jgi:RNA polymerase sigma-70 factor (ECF subfamily)